MLGQRCGPSVAPYQHLSPQTASCDLPPKDQAFLLLVSPRLCRCSQPNTPCLNLCTFAPSVRGFADDASLFRLQVTALRLARLAVRIRNVHGPHRGQKEELGVPLVLSGGRRT